MEKKLIETSVVSTTNLWLEPPPSFSGDGAEKDGDDDYSNEGLQELKNLLRERTAQLKVLMDTIECLQIEPGDSSQQNILVKRMVELTAELSSQTAALGLAERKIMELEADRSKKGNLCNTLKRQVHNSLRAVEELQIQYKVIAGELMETEKARRDDRLESRLENEEISRCLKESEAQVQSLEITVNELNVQAKLSEEVDFQKWLENVILNDDRSSLESLNKEASTSMAEAVFKTTESPEGVKELVFSLLEAWRLEYPHHVASLRKADGHMSKSEQKFMQRVADLVTEAHDQFSKASFKLRQLDMQNAKCQVSEAILSSRLKTCVKHLHIYRYSF